MATLHSLVYQPEQTDVSSAKFNRIPVESAKLIAGHGIEGDRKAGRNPKRQLNLMSRETLDMLTEQGFKTSAGEMGEQIQISGLDFESLATGMRLKIGDSAIIEIHKPRTGCVWLEHIQGKITQELGWMASVIESGNIHVGDSVAVFQIPEIA